jgi:hypothetical protein
VHDLEREPGGLRRLLEPVDGAVSGTPVRDEGLDLTVDVLRRDVGDEMLDVLGLVEHRDDDRDSLDARHGRRAKRGDRPRL